MAYRSRGRTYVDLVCCLERVSQAATTRYPSVDHLRVCHDQPTAGLMAQLARDLRAGATQSLADSFDLWRQLAHDFDDAAAQLDELRYAFDRKAPADDRSEYQALLRARIQEVQRCRRLLGEATDHLEEQLAAELDNL
jgi:hypothetical protein